MGRRAAAELSLRLTQDSAFTPPHPLADPAFGGLQRLLGPCELSPPKGDQAEYWALRQRVALMDLSALHKFEVTGPDAEALLQWSFSRNVSKLDVSQSAYG